MIFLIRKPKWLDFNERSKKISISQQGNSTNSQIIETEEGYALRIGRFVYKLNPVPLKKTIYTEEGDTFEEKFFIKKE
ncbi:hypothetical protein TUBRATIS_005030 [Tubulinosema ratisbonensis]|uniref:Uncharacterized protein n=1 Tax=Tubulinosema ratisbonensis TaxID=291195 RepID=A0A437APG5_9MICR|nr:hypothetical protein TUBRATIS_005030 [Tubulinosema ratisbonensis]